MDTYDIDKHLLSVFLECKQILSIIENTNTEFEQNLIANNVNASAEAVNEILTIMQNFESKQSHNFIFFDRLFGDNALEFKNAYYDFRQLLKDLSFNRLAILCELPSNFYIIASKIDEIIARLNQEIQEGKKRTKKKILLSLIKFICLIIIFAPCDNNKDLDIASVLIFLIAPLVCLPIVLVITTDIFNIKLDEEFMRFCISTQFGTTLLTLAILKLALY